MKYFCFYFPVRLGVLITTVLSGLQGLIVLIYFLLKDASSFKTSVTAMQESIDEYSSNEFFDRFLSLSEDCKKSTFNIFKFPNFLCFLRHFRVPNRCYIVQRFLRSNLCFKRDRSLEDLEISFDSLHNT